MDNSKVLVYCHPNPEMRSFLVGEEISSFRVEHFTRPFSDDSSELKSLGRTGERLVRDIMLLPEIREVYIKPHELLIKKKESASWDLLEKKVCMIMERALRRKKIKVV